MFPGNFVQFYATKSERDKNQKREYEAQLQYRAHLQAFIDRWRCQNLLLSVEGVIDSLWMIDNANRAAQAQSKIKILEKLPEYLPSLPFPRDVR